MSPVADMTSSGYSSSTGFTEFTPVSSDTMDTGDYELYDPRVHGVARSASTRGRARMIVNRPRKPKQEVTYLTSKCTTSKMDTLTAFMSSKLY